MGSLTAGGAGVEEGEGVDRELTSGETTPLRVGEGVGVRRSMEAVSSAAEPSTLFPGDAWMFGSCICPGEDNEDGAWDIELVDTAFGGIGAG